ncbi:hypothetical protein H4V97_002842 [Flavobacterium sp. CG_23.5]|uniref:hypothetical protein n=1 Tax=Flavobacterium sp. CG_23.5 TaxID=2760708 RepID=UPI001AEAD4BB|nr:hypothetical protein [Flavobacterium sp. CG_23.5]MBP2284524.1 hypothetical protein [Flavobacterium sp. CG_23.5]
MKKFLFLVIIVGLSLNGYSQNEISTKFKAVPPKKKEAIPPKVNLPKVKPYVADEIPKNDFIVPKNDVINPDEVYKKNQDLGSFNTSSVSAKVRYRDAAYVDGDKIRVYLNDKMIQPEVLLNGEFQGFEITLEKGVNKIDFEALNEGFAPPNTAEFQVYDDKGTVVASNQWNIGLGFKATIILMKE